MFLESINIDLQKCLIIDTFVPKVGYIYLKNETMKSIGNSDFSKLIARLINFIAETQELLKIMKEEIKVLERANKKLKVKLDELKKK